MASPAVSIDLKHKLRQTPLSESLFPRRSLTWLWVLHGLTMAALAGVIGYQLYTGYARVDALERQRLQGQASMIGKNLSRELEAIHRALLRVRGDLAHWGYLEAPGLPAPRLKTLVEAMSGVRTFNILDATGTVRASNHAELIGENFGYRPYFQTARRLLNPSAVIVSSPFRTSLGIYAMNLVMMIPGANGEFSGVVSVTLDPDFFTTLMGSVLYAPDMWCALAHGDGTQFLMYPEHPNQGGKNLRHPGSFFSRHMESGQQETVLTGTVYATGEERMAGMITISPPSVSMDTPLVVTVSRDLYAIHGDWLIDAGRQIALYLVLLISITLGLMLISRRQRSFDRNISENTRALEEARRQAEAASAAKSAFLATMSHEIRTPITSVLGMVDLLHTTGLNREQAGYVETLSSSTRALLTILNDILDISKIEAGKITLESVEFELHEAARTVISLNQAMAAGKQLDISLVIDRNVPETVAGDPVRFKQILYNLVSNAVKFTEAGSVLLRLSVMKREQRTATIHCSISDTGIGIAKHELDRLFKPFSQVDISTTRKFGGTGLGLAIVQRLIDLAGGEIGVDSEVGRGSRFWFTLPFLVTERVKAAEPMVIPNAAAERPPARPVHVLIAEDNRINQMLIRSMLQKHGHTAEVVENGRQALEAVMTRDFDIILMDMQMPEMDGEEATKAIRALPSAKSKLPVLALTADVMTEHRARYIQAGVDDVVAKPIDWRVLLEAIHHYTEKVYVL